MRKIHPFFGISSGEAPLKSISISDIAGNEDMSLGIDSGTTYIYKWNATSTTDEDIPNIINPTDNTGAGRWELIDIRISSISISNISISNLSTTVRSSSAAQNSVLSTELGVAEYVENITDGFITPFNNTTNSASVYWTGNILTIVHSLNKTTPLNYILISPSGVHMQVEATQTDSNTMTFDFGVPAYDGTWQIKIF